MSTNGTIAIRSKGKTIRTYNHSDSYPSYLGVELGKFARDADAEVIAAQIATVTLVKEDDTPTAEQLAACKEAGLWQDVSRGTDWYAALRSVQGDIEATLATGYFLNWTWGDNQEWGYLVDFDHSVLKITRNGYPFQAVGFDLLKDDESLRALMAGIEEKAYA